jgi:cation-transporting ATPase E
VFGKTFDVNTTDISTAATMLLLIVGFIILFNICKPVNIFRGVVWGGCLTGCILCIIFLPKLFAITGMSTKCIMLFVVFSIATEAVLRYLTLLVKGLQKGYRKIRHREEGI